MNAQSPIVTTAVPHAIGLSGFASSGKTTAALYIEQRYGYERRHIAEPLRAMLAELLRQWGYSEELIARYLTGDLKEAMIVELGVTSRHCQITLGTEWGRKLIAPDIWARLWAYQAERSGRPVMNDSVRFPNEEAACGTTILLRRPGTGPVAYRWGGVGRLLYRWFGCMWGVHDSERVDRLQPTYVIDNDGPVERLYAEIDRIMDRAPVESPWY